MVVVVVDRVSRDADLMFMCRWRQSIFGIGWGMVELRVGSVVDGGGGGMRS